MFEEPADAPKLPGTWLLTPPLPPPPLTDVALPGADGFPAPSHPPPPPPALVVDEPFIEYANPEPPGPPLSPFGLPPLP